AKGVQVRDAIDLKRLMMTVVIAMVPCLLFGIYNVGYQHYLALGQQPSFGDIITVGVIQVLPIVIVAYADGGVVEVVFAIMRKHPINEGFLVTGMLIPLVMPPDIPLWQVALATVFAVLIGKEVFGGTGMNVVNVALTARAFLYFAYPVDMAGEVWTYVPDKTQVVAGYSGAKPLGVSADFSTKASQAIDNAEAARELAIAEPSAVNKLAAEQAQQLADSLNNGHLVVDALNNAWHEGLYDFYNLFYGLIPGSIGETSTLMCLIGALI